MEQGSEGDAILVLALGQLGVKGLEDSSVTLDNLSAELLVEIVAKGLNLISDGDTNISPKLPPNVASRHRICTGIAKTVKDMGYSGDGIISFCILREAVKRSLTMVGTKIIAK